MFKTASQDRETTATLQADFLGSLFADQDHHVRSNNSTISDQQTEFANVPPQSYEPYMAPSHDSRPALNVTGPNLDFTDFESWLSDFESSTIPELNTIIPSDIPTTGEPMEEFNAANMPSMANTDWDAVSCIANRYLTSQIFLSWLNPEGQI
jgi:hypothetical protein